MLLVAGRTWLEGAGSPDEHRVPVRLLDRLWLSSRRGIELDVVCGVDRVLKLLGVSGSDWDLSRYDAVVLLPDLCRNPFAAKAQRIIDRVATTTRVLRVAPGLGAAEEPAGPWPGTTDVAIEPVPGDCPAAMVAETVGATLSRVLDRAEPRHAGPRVESVSDHLHRIAVTAAAAFAVESSAISVTAEGQARTLAVVGPLGGPPCPRAAVSPAPTVVLDTWRDPRLAGDPRLDDRNQVRFFAAHPIEDGGGRAIGSISVSDARPRSEDEFDAAVLRDLALLASAEIQYAALVR